MANKKVVPSSEDDLEVDSLDAPEPAGKEDGVILPEAAVPLEAEAAGSEDAPVREATSTPTPVFDTEQSCTTVGPSVVIRGRIRSEENLVVHGRIEAGIKSTKDVRIEATGIINADLDVRCVWVAGIVVGDIHASQLVELAPEARVVGDIYTSRLIVKDGAKFRGRVEMDGLQALEAIRPPQPVAAAQPAAKKIPAGKPTPAVAEVIWSDVEDLAPTPAHRPAAMPQSEPVQPAAARSAQVAVTGGRVGQPRTAPAQAVPPRTPEKPAAPAPAPAPAEKPAEGDKGIGSWFRRQ